MTRTTPTPTPTHPPPHGQVTNGDVVAAASILVSVEWNATKAGLDEIGITRSLIQARLRRSPAAEQPPC